MADFLIYALLVGVGIALVSGPLGAFAVWRRMSYFGDTLAHSALIGVAIGLLTEVNVTLTIIFSSCIIAALLVILEEQNALSTDTLLGVLSHGSLAVGLICVSLFSVSNVNLYGYLFGDFLTVTSTEVILIYLAIGATAVPLVWFWKPLLMLSIDEELARVEGHNVVRLKLILMLMVACIIALAMKIVGVMLITSLLIIPAAAARRVSSSPEAMAAIASCIGMVCVALGLGGSYLWNTPAGPSVVLAALGLFLLMSLLPKKD